MQQWINTVFQSKDWPGIEALATSLTAIGAFLAALFSWLSVRDNRQAAKTQRTLELLDSAGARFTVEAVNSYLTQFGLTRSRDMLDHKKQNRAFSKAENEQVRNVASYIAYSSELVTRGIVDRDLFLDRASVVVSHAIILFEASLPVFFRRTLRPNAIREVICACLAHAKAAPGSEPELRDYHLPKDYP